MNAITEKLKALYANRLGLRIASTAALLAYPVGGVLLIVLPRHLEFVGGIFLAGAALSFFYLLPSYVQRVAFLPHILRFVDKDCRLDELELDLRRRAQSFAYKILSMLVLAGLMYLVLGADMARDADPSSLWMPVVDDHWLAILFGALFFVLMLPIAYLSWMMPEPVLDDEPGEKVRSQEASRLDTFVMTGMLVGLTMGITVFDDALLWMFVGTALGFLLDFLLKRMGKKKEG
ncbi:MAG: hypothetical protein AAGJ79_11215 [Verrucomicrobiota bacterium]